MSEALPIAFSKSYDGGLDLNSTVGNALAASIHLILRDAMVVTLEVCSSCRIVDLYLNSWRFPI